VTVSNRECRVLLLLVGAVLCCLGSVADARGQEAPGPGVGPLLTPPRTPVDPFPDLTELEVRAQELASRPDANVVAELIKTARNALVRARALREGQEVQAAERAKQIVWAALAAASHRLALHHEERELSAATRRRQLAKEAADAAAMALVHAQAQQAQPASTTTP